MTGKEKVELLKEHVIECIEQGFIKTRNDLYHYCRGYFATSKLSYNTVNDVIEYLTELHGLKRHTI